MATAGSRSTSGSGVFQAAVALATLAQDSAAGAGRKPLVGRPPLAAAVTPGLAAGQSGRQPLNAVRGQLAAAHAQPLRPAPPPAPPLASLPPPSAPRLLVLRVSDCPRRPEVYLRQRRSRSWAGLAATSGQSPPAGTAQFAVCRGAAPRAPEGRALTAEAGLMPGGAAAKVVGSWAAENWRPRPDHTPAASSERGVSCLLLLPSLGPRGSPPACKCGTRPADADRRHEMGVGRVTEHPPSFAPRTEGRTLVEAVKGQAGLWCRLLIVIA